MRSNPIHIVGFQEYVLLPLINETFSIGPVESECRFLQTINLFIMISEYTRHVYADKTRNFITSQELGFRVS